MKTLPILCLFMAGLLFLAPPPSSFSESSYLRHITDLSSGLDGPDKSRFRDALMTMNPSTGSYNHEAVRGVFKQREARRTQGGQDFNWQEIPSSVAGRVRSIMVDPNNPDRLWAGAVTGGLWYTEDFRNNSRWFPVSDQWESLSISCITHDPQNPNIFYVGTGESYTSVRMYRESASSGVGIYKTTDGGESWQLINSTLDFDYVNDIVVRVEDGASVIYAAVASGTYQGRIFNSTPTDGIYRSVDGGQQWSQVLPNIPGESVPFSVADLELTSDGKLFAGTMRNLANDGGGCILSSDDGVNWTIFSQYRTDILAEGEAEYDLELKPGRVVIRSAPSDPLHLFAIATSGWINEVNQIRDHGFFTRILESKDGGASWAYITDPADVWASIPWHALSMDIDPNDDDKLVIAGLDVYTEPDVSLTDEFSWIQLSDWFSMYYFSDELIRSFELTGADSMLNHFVHADIHAVQFLPESSDEVLFASDGGVGYTNNMSLSSDQLIGDRLVQYPSFVHRNKGLTTTQYYTAAIHPLKGINQFMAGSQDNSTHLISLGQEIEYANMISGGDGAYCFFDKDDPFVLIASSQVNNYYVHVDEEIHRVNVGHSAGTFINPVDYDDRSNLLYTNLAVDGGFELLIPELQGEFLDQIAVINLNKFIGKSDLGLDTVNFVTLGTGSTSAFSVIKVSPHDIETDATLFLGNQFGDVFKVSGMPFEPIALKLDRNQLPVGYISAIDIGDTNNDILVTFSNYGVASVWHTYDGGLNWHNVDRNLPDIPVRDGRYNPLDDQQVIIATEAGIWGLEHLADPSAQWKQYNEGFPNVRVDMIQLRGSDSTILAATHGRGLFVGKFNQGELKTDPTPLLSESQAELIISPNPATDQLRISGIEVANVWVMDLLGREVISDQTTDDIAIGQLPAGVYILKIMEKNGDIMSEKFIKK